MSASDASSLPARNRKSLYGWLLSRVANIWFGVVLLVLLFVYSSLGSAAPPIRQGALADWFGLEFLRFEKTEMQWFSWWPFHLMIVLLCFAMILVTLRFIRFTMINLGVWMIHTGIIVLAISSAIYFGKKVEGDTVIYESKAYIMAPGMTEPATMVLHPEASIEVGQGSRRYHIQVARMNPNYELRTEGLEGKRTQEIWLNVHSVDPPKQFIRVLLVGYPELTEDVVAGPDGGSQRARNVLGTRLADESLDIQLGYDPVDKFYVMQTGAIYARTPRDPDWTHELRIHGLPRYYEYLSRRDGLWPTHGYPTPPLRPLDLEPEIIGEGSALNGLEIRVTDYLPYAHLESRWIEGDRLNPMVSFRLDGQRRSEPFELFAFDPWRSDVPLDEAQFMLRFRWAASAEERVGLAAPADPRIRVQVDDQVKQTLPIRDLLAQGGVEVEGTDYRLEIKQLVPAGMKGHHHHGDHVHEHDFGEQAAAFIRVTRGDRTFTRLVLSDEPDGGRDVDDHRQPLETLEDPALHLTYLDPAPQHLLFVSGPTGDTVDVVFSRSDGTYYHREARVGEPFSLVPSQAPMIVETLLERATRQMGARIIPRRQRESLSRVGQTQSLIRVEVNDGHSVESLWLPFNQYAFPGPERARSDRFRYAPRRVRLSDGRNIELMYSRWREPLPSEVALDRFVLNTYPGGDRPSEYISWIRMRNNGEWSQLYEVKSNHNKQHGSFWYFQSQWDPGIEAYTVLGVGNREAVHEMLFGTILAIVGMIYAFYIKPILIRRRKEAALATAAAMGRLPRAGVPSPSASEEEREVAHV